jgi:hypothetical protein
MSQHDSAIIRKPRTDDRPLWDLQLATRHTQLCLCP